LFNSTVLFKFTKDGTIVHNMIIGYVLQCVTWRSW